MHAYQAGQYIGGSFVQQQRPIGAPQGVDFLHQKAREDRDQGLMPATSLRLWDPVVRVFHLSIAGVFVANYFFNENQP